MSRGAYADERPARADLRLFITGLGIGQICSWGSVYYSFPLIAEAMGRELGWSKPDLYGAATIGLLLSGLAACCGARHTLRIECTRCRPQGVSRSMGDVAT